MIRVAHSVLAGVGKSLAFLPNCPRLSQQRNGVLSKGKGWSINFRGALCVLLVISLLATSTPAAAQTIVTVTGEWHAHLGFWLRANHVPAKIYRALTGQNPERAKRQEKQEDRDARVSRIRIHPGDVTLRLDERINLAAVAYDQDDGPVGGVRFTWEAQDEDRNDAAVVSPNGEFEALVPGRFRVTVQGAGKTDHVRITVRDGERRKKDEKPLRTTPTSTRDLPSPAFSLSSKPIKRSTRAGKATARRVRRGHVYSPGAPLPYLPADGWNNDNYWSADDPGNEPGTPPGAPLDDGAGSGNFQFAAPIYGSSGRGVNISLAATFNSRLWNKASSQMTFDIDRGWPAPGWSLGFGKIVGMGNGASMIIDADGTRHGFNGTVTTWGGSQTFTGHTTDGTLIDYSSVTDSTGALTSAWAKLANGTIISYYTGGPGAAYPTGILDPNGNYITITYVNNTGPQIQTITDTLGRAVTFYYDSNNLLTAIQAPGYLSGTRDLVRFHYKHQSLSYSFAGLTAVVRDSNPWVIDAIYYPATSTGYWLGDSDSYSTYGMPVKVIEQRNMTFSASSLNDMGTVGQGQMTRQEVYNYPLSTGSPGGSSLTDAPTYTSMTESWTRDGTSTTDQAVTNYEVHQNTSPRTVTITLPNGTKSTQKSNNAPGQYNDGLVVYDETLDSGGALLQSSSLEWEPGAYDSARPTRVQATNERLQTNKTEFTYGTVYNQVTEARNYDYGGTTLLSSTRTQYQNSSSYTNNHIFNLPLVVEIFAADNVTRVSRTEYQYDGQTLVNTPSVVMHSSSYDPYTPQYWIPTHCVYANQYGCQQWEQGHYASSYQPATDYRGNVTQVTNYTNVTTGSATGAITETRRYDITGNLVKASSACCEQTTLKYGTDADPAATQYAYVLSQTRGSATDPYAQVTTSSTYDFNTGLLRSAKDANGRQSTNDYDAASLRPTSSTAPTAAHTDYAYNDLAMTVTSTTYLTGSTIADQNVKLLNGRGQVRQEKTLAASTVWDIVDAEYDSMGRLVQQSQPYRSGSPNWTKVSYDGLGRPKKVIAPDYTLPDASDGSTTETFYNEATRPSIASSLPGETSRVRDAWGRERWGRTDAQGRLVEVVEPNPSGSGSVFDSGALLTTYTYNTLGNLVQVTQGAQTRSFKYDSLGRLLAQKLAETSATLNDAGAYQVSGGTWSDVLTYDDRSNLTSRTDARGVKTVFNYNGDPLNRLQSVSWDTNGFGDTANPIMPAATVSYQYRTKSTGSDLLDIAQPKSVTTSGVSTETYDFDGEGRVNFKSLVVNGRPAMDTNYTYDNLDRITDIDYSAKNLVTPAGTRPHVHQDYDLASRLTSLTVDGAVQASNIVYNAASQTTSLNVGTGTNQISESYNYDSNTGLLTGQTVARSSSPTTYLLNLAYDYAGANGKRTGQLTKILNNLNHNKDRGYSYDALGRLITAQGGPAGSLWTQNYSYDRYGNRLSVSASGNSARNRDNRPTERQASLETTSTGRSMPEVVLPAEKLAIKTEMELPDRTEASGSTSKSHHASRSAPTSPLPPIPVDGHASLSYDSATNRITTSGFAYDATGNQVRALIAGGASQRFQYDAANRLVYVKTDASVIIASYTYGDSNERLIADEGGVKTYYVSEGGTTIVEYTESGGSTTPAWSKSYVYLGARLLSTLTPNGSGGTYVQYHHPDRLGTRLVSNAQDTTSFEQVTLPFGTALDAESPGFTKRRFTSYDRSATTGLDYAINRHYDPQQGRFTQVDPIGMSAVTGDNPQSLNMYSYCGNDPVNQSDPEGLFFGKLFKWIGTALKILSIVALVVMTVIIFAPASSFAFKAALWMFFHVLLPLSQVPVLGAFVPLGTFGSPQWNPQSRGMLGNSFQGQGSTCPPDCQEQITLPPVSAGTIYANYSAWEKLWRGLDIGLDKGLTTVVGFSGFITFGASKKASKEFARLLGGQAAAKEWTRDNAEREASWFHTGGEALGLAWDIATGEEIAVLGAKAAGWGGKLALHGAHHTFRWGGRLSHLQLNLWKRGVKGSQWVKRIALPSRRLFKEKVFRKF